MLCRNHVGNFYCLNRTYSSFIVNTTVVKTSRNTIKNLKLTSAVCVFSSDSKKRILNLEKKAEEFKDAFEQKKEQIKETEHRIRQKGFQLVEDIKHQKEITGHKIREKKNYIIKDIQETKAKVKEKIEEVVEVVHCIVIKIFFYYIIIFINNFNIF